MPSAKKIFWLLFSFSFITNLNGQANLLSKKVYISISENTLLGHIDNLYTQENISLAFNSSRVNLDEVISLPIGQISINDLVSKLFQGHSLRLTPSTNKVLISFRDKKEESFLTIRGYIRDELTGENLVGATIWDETTYNSSFTSENGFYSLTVPVDSNEVKFAYLGYETITLKGLNSSEQNINLSFDNQLTQVVIKESISDNFLHGSGSEKIDLALTNGFNSVSGDNDVINAVRIDAGVQSGNEGQTGLYVRGGSPDQNLILFEGISLYEVNHTAGFASMFIEESIHNIDFIKNGYPARYGGRLSSVLNIQLKDGNMSGIHGSVQASLPAIKAHLEGPIFSEKTTFNIAGKVSYLDSYINNVVGNIVDYDINLDYSDIVGKVTHRFSPASKMSFSVYTGGDNFGLFREQTDTNNSTSLNTITNNDLKWGSDVWSLNFSNIMNDKLQLSMTLGGVNYKYSSRGSFTSIESIMGLVSRSELDVISFSNINDVLANVNFDYYLDAKHVLKFGGGWINHRYNPAVRSNTIIQDGVIDTIESAGQIISADELSLFIEDTYHPNKYWQINAGLHFSGFNVGGTQYRNTQPRFSIISKPDDNNRITFSYTRMNQYVHLLVNPGIGLPADLWVPSTDEIEPEQADQVSLSYSRKISNGIDLNVSGYVKHLDNLLEYRTDTDLIFIGGIPEIQNDPDWRNRIEVGSSTSRGMEVQIRKRSGKLNGWVSYALSKTDRLFETINNGEEFPYKYDRRHDLNIGIKYSLNDKWSVSTNWTYGTGNAFSLAVEGFRDITGDFQFIAGERNNFRFSAFHHLDLQATYNKIFSNDNRLTFNIGLYNAYNRRNPYFIYIFDNPISNEREARRTSLFPILPNINIGYSF